MPDLLAVNHYRKKTIQDNITTSEVISFTILRAFAKYFKILYCGFSFGLGHILSTICSYHLLGYDDIPNMGIGSQQTKYYFAVRRVPFTGHQHLFFLVEDIVLLANYLDEHIIAHTICVKLFSCFKMNFFKNIGIEARIIQIKNIIYEKWRIDDGSLVKRRDMGIIWMIHLFTKLGS
ncbi:hypothetical protein ACJX0J_039664 [Zea mays]